MRVDFKGATEATRSQIVFTPPASDSNPLRPNSLQVVSTFVFLMIVEKMTFGRPHARYSFARTDTIMYRVHPNG